jgi:N-acetylneuraminic acid mutarotase
MGATGATGPQGPIGIANRGTWTSSTLYKQNDALSDASSFWLALIQNQGSEPSLSNPNWQLLAAGINNRGAWNGTANYSTNDAVTDGGSYWLALSVNNNSQPSGTNTNWQLLAAQGATGAPGSPGSQGPKGDQGPMGLPGLPGQNPVGAALTTTSNTFAGNQIINGSLILGGAGSGIQFSDGSVQATASMGGGGGIPAGYMITGTTPVAPPGYTLSGSFSFGNAWFTMAPMPTARIALAVAAVNGKIYAIGGFSNQGVVNTVEVFDPAAFNGIGSWSPTPAMPTARHGLAVAVVNGKIYAIGGQGSSSLTNVVEVYDPNSNSWSTTVTIVNLRDGTLLDVPLALMPTVRVAFAAAAVNGKIYAIGGGGADIGGLNTVEVYDPISNSWGTAASMPTRRTWVAAAVVNGKIYAMGGRNSSGVTNTVEVYDPISNSWSTAASMPTPRERLAAAAVNGKIYAIGGVVGAGTGLNTVEVYDPISNSWSTAASMPAARDTLAAGDVNGLIYAVGGYHDPSFVNATEQFSPPVTIYTFIKN